MTKFDALFLDRDGIVNKDTGYISKVGELYLCEGFVTFLGRVIKHFSRVFIVTNQSGVAREYFSYRTASQIQEETIDLLSKRGITIDDWRMCPHYPGVVTNVYSQQCACRKPATGMIDDLVVTHKIARDSSIMIGDKPSDVQLAINAQLHSGFLVDACSCPDCSAARFSRVQGFIEEF